MFPTDSAPVVVGDDDNVYHPHSVVRAPAHCRSNTHATPACRGQTCQPSCSFRRIPTRRKGCCRPGGGDPRTMKGMDRRAALATLGFGFFALSRDAYGSPRVRVPPTPVKVVVVGDTGVGKTSMLLRYVTHEFPRDYIPSVVDTYTADARVDGKRYSLSLCDTSGSADQDRARPLSYLHTDVFVVAFSVVAPDSFDAVTNRWIPEILHFAPNAPYLLVGTKSDLRDDTATKQALASKGLAPVSTAQAQALAANVRAFGYRECSALNGVGLDNAFEAAVRRTAGPTKRAR